MAINAGALAGDEETTMNFSRALVCRVKFMATDGKAP
jgi:hypothetical protein